MSIDDELEDDLDELLQLTRRFPGTRREGARGGRAGARRIGFEPGGSPEGRQHPFTEAGPKLKELREKSGWTVSEIADRTGVSLKVLKAFEQGDSAAAGAFELSDLERLASACCGTLTDLFGSEIPSVPKRSSTRRVGLGWDPWG